MRRGALAVTDEHTGRPPGSHAREPQVKAARQAGPLAEVLAGGGQAVAEGVVRQQVLQPNRKAMEAASAIDISQVGGRAPWVGAGHGWLPVRAVVACTLGWWQAA